MTNTCKDFACIHLQLQEKNLTPEFKSFAGYFVGEIKKNRITFNRTTTSYFPCQLLLFNVKI